MNIGVTGSLGHISKPLTHQLLEQGHAVTVVSSNAGRQRDIAALGATAAIGSIQDAAFLTQTFKGTDAVYLMEPPPNSFHPSADIIGLHTTIAGSYKAAGIRHYEYFGYMVNEALFLSEEATIHTIVENIRQQYSANIDKFSQGIIIAHLATLLGYTERFSQRQFITRKVANHQLLDGLEALLSEYFGSGDAAVRGLPTVQYLAEALHVSPNYLSSLLKSLRGLNTQQLIHEKLIERAKERLSTTGQTISEIAYGLGFEHPQSFSKLFKAKTSQSPLQFRAGFN